MRHAHTPTIAELEAFCACARGGTTIRGWMRELVTRAREDLERTGCASFPSFLTASALENAVGEAARKAPVAYRTGWPTEQRVLRCPFSP